MIHTDTGRPAAVASGDAPHEWVEGVTRLRAMPVPPALASKDWPTIVTDAERFLVEWGAAAARLGWPDSALFGVQRHVPSSWRGRELVALLGGRPVVALTAAEAVIDVRPGVRHVYRRLEHDPLHPAERCLLWELGCVGWRRSDNPGGRRRDRTGRTDVT